MVVTVIVAFTTVPDGVTELGEIEHWAPCGAPRHERFTC